MVGEVSDPEDVSKDALRVLLAAALHRSALGGGNGGKMFGFGYRYAWSEENHQQIFGRQNVYKFLLRL